MNNLLSTVIIDDEAHNNNVLKRALASECPQVEIRKIFDDSNQALSYLKNNKVDLVFLDIMMPQLTGIQLLEALWPLSFKVIFVTAYSQYAAKAFRLSAVDFLEKPIGKEELKQAVEKVSEIVYPDQLSILAHNLSGSKLKKVCLPVEGGFDFVPFQEIVALIADGNYSFVHFINGKKKLITKSLKNMEAILEPDFYRIHHGHIINIDLIKHIDKGAGGLVKMADGSEWPVSREKKEAFMQQLGI